MFTPTYRVESVRRRWSRLGAAACAVALMPLLATAVAAQPAKLLKLRDSTTQAVEYGLGSAGAPPQTTIVIQPGQTRELFPVPNRDVLYYRYSRTSGWAAPFPIPLVNDPVYKWKFVPGGNQPGLVGAPEIP
jgi:hypothetical protein